MTGEDEDAAISRLVGRYSGAKKRRAALMSEANQCGATLQSLGQSLRQLEFCTEYWSGREDGHTRNRSRVEVKPYPEQTKIQVLLDDLKTTAAELRELRQLMKDANVSLD